VQVGGQAMADRYTYIPSIGLFFALVFLAHEIAQRVRLPKLIAFGGIGLVSLACILVTENQMQYWRDGESLFRQAVAVNPRNDVALIDLGVALNAHGKPEEALAAYRQAEKIDSSRYQLHNNIGNILGTLGHPDEALTEYRAAIRLRPDREFLHSSAGIQLAVLGQFAEALAEFSTAQKLDATAATPRLEAAKVLFKLGRDAEGVEEFRAAVRLAPDDYPTLATVAHYLAANENAAARDEKNSLPLALKANELSGHRQPMVFDILGMALAANGDFTNAVTCAQNALDLATAAQLKRTEPIQTRLELYKKNLPWRESFRASNINTP
jgi:tetratricopeptide (TPR) repeat protein